MCRDCDYPQFLLSRWPFNLVADSDAARFWAGPRNGLTEVTQVINEILNFPETRLHLVWGELGVGKSHALRYVLDKVESASESTATAYTEISPRDQVRNFLTLYSQMIRETDLDRLAQAYAMLVRKGAARDFEKKVCRKFPSLVPFFHAYQSGVADMGRLKDWLAGGRLGALERRSIGVSVNIDNDESARDVLVALVEMFRLSDRRSGRFVWAIDEFQRVKRAGPRRLLEISDMLRSLVNSCPNGLAILLGVRETSRDDFLNNLTPDLRELIRGKSLHFAAFSREDASNFLRDRLSFFRCPKSSLPLSDSPFPFSQNGVSELLTRIENSGEEFRLKPRDVLYCAGTVCKSVLSDFEGTGGIEPEMVDAFFPERPAEDET